jgi:hypothetical protein
MLFRTIKTLKMMNLLHLFMPKASLILLLVGFFFTTHSQTGMQDVSWFELDPPKLGTDQYEAKNVAVDMLDNGKIILSYTTYPGQKFTVNKFDILTNDWEEVDTFQINTGIGSEVNRIISYTNGNKLFYAILRQNTSLPLLTLIEFDENEELTVHFQNEPVNIYEFFKFDMTYDAVNEIVYFSALTSNFASTVYAHQIGISGIVQPLVLNNTNAVPVAAIDAVNNLFYWATVNTNDEIFIYSGGLVSNPANLTLTSQGNLNTNLFANPAIAGELFMIDKNNGAPDLVFKFNLENPNDGTYRVNLGTLTGELQIDANEQIFGSMVDNIVFSQGLAVTGRGDNTYLYGYHDWETPAYALEVSASGNEVLVAADNNPATNEGIDNQNSVKIGSSPLYDRLVGYYRGYGYSPETPGRFTITNRVPSVQSIATVSQGCFAQNSTGIFAELILFDDPDGDIVDIVANSVQSNGGGTVGAMQDINGNWQLFGNFDQPGVVEISFAFTDGLDTLFHQFNYDPGQEPTLDFKESMFNFCFSDLPLQSSDLLNELASGELSLLWEPTLNQDEITWADFENNQYIFEDEAVISFQTIDENGCEYEYISYVMLFENPTITMAVQPSSCGQNDGSATATVTGANGNFTEYWSTGANTTNAISNLAPGTYFYNIEDDMGCKATAQANVQATGLVVNGTVSGPTCHNGNDGIIDLNLSGFTNPTLLWSTGQGSTTISGLSAGTYEVTVWDDPNCKVTASFTLANPAQFSVDFDITLPTTCSANDGEITVASENNASGNVTYVWTGGATGNSFSGIGNGVYTVTAQDGACTFSQEFTINSASGPTAMANVKHADCGISNGAISLITMPNAGEEITGIEWDNGATSQNIGALSPGIYAVEITQSDGCVSTFEFEVRTKRPEMQEICMVSVDSLTNTNLVIWEKPTAADIDYYNIYRETVVGEFMRVGQVSYADISVFNDVVASPQVRSWRYRISAVNTCGVESHLSPIHKTVHVVMEDLGAGLFAVKWDNYEGMNYSEYTCVRRTALGDWEITLPVALHPYYIDEPPTTQNLDYFIEIEPEESCFADFGRAKNYNSSRSNRRKNVFNPGDGTGDPNNDLEQFENPNFGVEIFPNPSNGLFNLNLTVLLPNTSIIVEVTDLTGRTILLPAIKDGMNAIDLSRQAAGSYIIKVTDGSYLQSFKVVKQ